MSSLRYQLQSGVSFVKGVPLIYKALLRRRCPCGAGRTEVFQSSIHIPRTTRTSQGLVMHMVEPCTHTKAFAMDMSRHTLQLTTVVGLLKCFLKAIEEQGRDSVRIVGGRVPAPKVTISWGRTRQNPPPEVLQCATACAAGYCGIVLSGVGCVFPLSFSAAHLHCGNIL